MTPARGRLSDWFAASGIFLFALSLRLVFLQELKSSPFFSNFGVDPEFYKQLAVKIAGGEFFPEGIFWFHSFYTYILALMIKLFGQDLTAIRTVQSVIGSFSCVLLYLIGKEVFGKWAGVLAGLLMAAYGFLILSEFTLESVFLSVFFCLGSLACLQAYEREKKVGPALIAAGFLSGLFILCRANTLPFVVFFWILFVSGTAHAKKNIRPALFFLGSVCAAVLPFSLMMYWRTGHFSFVGGHGGINFFMANGPFTDGTAANVPFIVSNPQGEHDGYIALAASLSGRTMDYFEASNYLFRWTLHYIFDHPFSYIYLFFKKLFLFFKAYEFADNVMNYYFIKEYYSSLLRSLPLGIGAALPLGITGMVLAVKDRKRLSLLFVYLLGYLFFMLQFLIIGRFRLPIIPIFILFAAYALSRLPGLMTERRGKDLLIFSMITGVLFFLCNRGVVENRGYADQFYNLGVMAAKSGDPSPAEGYFLQALRSNANHLPALENLGDLYLKRQDYEKAEYCFGRARLGRDASAGIWLQWAKLMERKNDIASAIQGYQKALELYPDGTEAKTHLEKLSPR